MKLIGYPDPGRASVWAQSSVYHLIGSGLRVGLSTMGHADITGTQGRGHGAGVSPGHGSSVVTEVLDAVYRRGPRKGQHKVKVVCKRAGWPGTVKGKVARAVGVGTDEDFGQAQALAAWLDGPTPAASKARAEILATIQAEHELGNRLLGLGRVAASHAARRLVDLRGVRPSATSIEDAAADAVSGMLCYVHRLPSGESIQVERRFDKVRAWSDRLARVCWRWGFRAAFRSLASWAVAGTTGDNTSGRLAGRGFVEEFTSDLADRLGRESWRFDDQVWFGPEHSARMAAVRWVYRVGYRDYCAGLGGAGAGRAASARAARCRCRVVGSVMLGAGLADACAGAGFESVGAWVRSCKGSDFFGALRRARARATEDLPAVRASLGAARATAGELATAIRDMRAASAVWAPPGSAFPRFVEVPSGTARIVGPDCLVRAGLGTVKPAPGRRVICPDQGWRGTGPGQSFAWEQAARRVESARDVLRFHLGRVRSIRAGALASFDQVLAGIHSDAWGNLRHLLGHVDKLGREHDAGKLNPANIGASKGKLPRRSALPGVRVEIRGRRRVGAEAVGPVQSWTMGGPWGWIVRAAGK